MYLKKKTLLYRAAFETIFRERVNLNPCVLSKSPNREGYTRIADI